MNAESSLGVISVVVCHTSSDAAVEGSLPWAIAQANQVSEGEVVISIAAELAGQVLAAADASGELPRCVLERSVRLEYSGEGCVEIASGLDVASGVELTVGGNVCLSSLGGAGAVSMEAGSVLGGTSELGEDAVLELNGVVVTGSIVLRSGLTLKGEDNVFTNSAPLVLAEAGLDVAAALEALSGSVYAPDGAGAACVVLPESLVSEQVVLKPLPDGLLGYQLSLYANVSADTTLTLEAGANLVLMEDQSFWEFGTLSCQGDNHVYFVNEKGELLEEGAQASFYGGTLNLTGCTVHGMLDVDAATTLVCEQTSFTQGGGLKLHLSGWDGTTTPACLSGIVPAGDACTPVLMYDINGLGGTKQEWGVGIVPDALCVEGFSSVLCLLALGEGDDLSCAAGSCWSACPVIVGSGARVEFGAGCRLEPGEDTSGTALSPTLILNDGATVVADTLDIRGAVLVSPGARIVASEHAASSGGATLHFSDGGGLMLVNWSGSTESLRSEVLAGVDLTANTEAPVSILLGSFYSEALGAYSGSYDSCGGDMRFACLGEGFGDYVVAETGWMPWAGSLMFSEGANLRLEGALTVDGSWGMQLAFEGNNIVRMAEDGQPHVLTVMGDGSAAVLLADATRFEVPVELWGAGLMSGENVVFAHEIPVYVNLGDWDGTAASVQETLSAALAELNCRFEHASPLLGLNVTGLLGDVTLNEETMADMVPEGFGGVTFRQLVMTGADVLVQAGVTLDVSELSVQSGTLTLESGAVIRDSLGGKPVISVTGGYWDAETGTQSACGRLVAEDVEFQGVTIECTGGDVSLTNCRGAAELLLTSVDASGVSQGTVTISGCDMSQMRISLEKAGSAEVGDFVCDLSGNYWGTTDMEAIKAMIEGYDERYIVLDNVLAELPGTDATAPVLTLLEPEMTKLAEGRTQVTFSWSSDDAAASYRLTVDGAVYEVEGGSHTLELADGTHCWSVTATDAAGNEATAEGIAFSLDATAPVLTLTEPEMTKMAEGRTQVTFSWSSDDAAASYRLTVDGAVYEVVGSSHTLELADGTHSWSVAATDAAGNVAVAEGMALSLDATAPVLTLPEPEAQKLAEGRTQVRFVWSSDDVSASYRLMVDGTVYDVVGSSLTLELADGTHSWLVTATDAAGNVAVAEGAALSLDTTAPALTLSEPEMQKLAEGETQVTFRWSSDDAAASYTLTVDGVDYEVAGCSHSLKLTDGTHSWSVAAVDAAGNVAEAEGAALSVDTSLPDVALALSQEKRAEGVSLVSFSWSCAEVVSYTLTVNEQAVYTGAENAFAMELADGEYSYSLVVTDAAGNSVTVAGETFTLDTTAPVAEMQAPQLTPGNGCTQVHFRWVCNEEATFELWVDEALVYKGAETEFSLELGDGEHSYSLTATDAKGNASAVTTESLLLDTMAPELTLAEPVMEKAEDGGVLATFRWSCSEEAVFRLVVDGQLVYEGSAEFRALHLEDGEHSYSLTATDASGHVATVEGATFTVDTTPPSLVLDEPTVSNRQYGKASVTFNWHLEGEEVASRYEVVVNGSTYRVDGNQTSCTVEALSDQKLYQYSVRAFDDAGNVAELSAAGAFSFDATAPVISDLAMTWSRVEEGQAGLTFHWGCDEDAVVRVDVAGLTADGEEFARVYDNLISGVSLLPVADGTYHYTFSATDAEGNCQTVEGDAFTVDTTAPVVDMQAPESSRTAEGLSTVRFRWVCHEASTFELMIDGRVIDLGAEGEYTTELGDGEHHYSLTAVDAYGNTSCVSGEPLLLDATTPELVLLEPQTEQGKEGMTPVTFSWSCNEEALYRLYVDGRLVYEGRASSYRCELADGEHGSRLEATDAAGNRAEVEGQTFWVDATPPRLVLDAPTVSGRSGGKASVTFHWHLEGDEAAVRYELLVNGTLYELPAGETSYTLSGLSDQALYSYSLRAYDASGNMVERTAAEPLAFDASSPALSGLRASWQKLSAGSAGLTVAWECEEAVSLRLLIRGVTLEGAAYEKSIEQPVSGQCVAEVPDGTYRCTIIATDAEGNCSQLEGEALTVDTTAPRLEWLAPGLQKKAEGVTEVLFRWSCTEAATFELLLDGEQVYTGSSTEFAAELGDGEHHYSLRATDAYGNSSTVDGESLLLDAHSPVLLLEEPELSRSADGRMLANFFWSSNEAAIFQLYVDDELAYAGRHGSCCVELADGMHSYRLTAADAAGNSTTAEGADFLVDSTAPILVLEEPVVSRRQAGTASVTFRWHLDGPETASQYVLVVNGHSYMLDGGETSHTLEGLSDKEAYEYRVRAYDAAGDVVEAAAASPLSFDATAPGLSEVEVSWQKQQDGVAALFFSLKSDEAAVFSLSLSGRTVGGESYSAQFENVMPGESVAIIPDGTYRCTITATDAEGNCTTTPAQELRIDATSPQLSTLRYALTPQGEDGVQAAFSWKGESGASYVLRVDGEVVYLGSACSATLHLSDGAHLYSLTAMDKAGNESEALCGSFDYAAAAPSCVVEKQGRNDADARLSWAGRAGFRYTLTVDGRKQELGEGVSCYEGWTGLRDGSHSYTLVVTELATGSVATYEGRLVTDTKAPSVTLSGSRFSKAAEGLFTGVLSWKGEKGAFYELSLKDARGKVLATYSGTQTSYVLSTPLPDGEFRCSVTAWDSSGNSSTAVGMFSVDATAPEVILQAAATTCIPTGKGRGKVTLNWQGEEGATYTLRVDGKRVYRGAATECSFRSADGEHVYSIIARDKAGNESEAVYGSFAFDASAPVVTMRPVQLIYDGAPEGMAAGAIFAWAVDEEASYMLSIDGGAAFAIQPADGSYRYAAALAAGSHRYVLTATDAGGRVSTVKGSFRVKAADTVAPTVSQLSHAVQENKDGSLRVTLRWKGSEKGCRYTVLMDGQVAWVGSSSSCSLRLPDGGRHEYRVIATDAAGLVSEAVSASLGYDAGVPELDVSQTGVNASSARLSWEPESGISYSLTVDGKVKQLGSGADHYADWTNLRDGKHRYTLVATEVLTGSKVTYSGSFVTDTKAPKVTLGKPSISKAGEGMISATLSWKCRESATYSLRVDGKLVYTGALTRYSFAAPLADGVHCYSVTATDAAGNESEAQAGTFRYDATAPDVILGQLSGTVVTSRKKVDTVKATLQWAGEDGVKYTVWVDGRKVGVRKLTSRQNTGGRTVSATLSTLSFTTKALALGEHSYRIVAKDQSGNEQVITGNFRVGVAEDGSAALEWLGDSDAAAMPAASQRLNWVAETAANAGGFRGEAASAPCYLFTLEEARQLSVRLSELSADATVLLHQVGGRGSIELAANAAAGLDRELTLSAGTYYLELRDAEGVNALSGSCTLDLELEKSGRKPALQACLAS